MLTVRQHLSQLEKTLRQTAEKFYHDFAFVMTDRDTLRLALAARRWEVVRLVVQLWREVEEAVAQDHLPAEAFESARHQLSEIIRQLDSLSESAGLTTVHACLG